MHPNLALLSDDSRTFCVRDGSFSSEIDLVDEIETTPRSLIGGNEAEEQIRVSYAPSEIIRDIADEELPEDYEVPERTTVMIVEPDELLDHETVANRDRDL